MTTPLPSYIHVREVDYRYHLNGLKNPNFEMPAAKGGLTIAYHLMLEPVTEGSAPVVVAYVGFARCNTEDVYSKKRGRYSAKARLDVDPFKFTLTSNLEVAKALPGDSEPYVCVHEREFPVIENVVEAVKGLIRIQTRKAAQEAAAAKKEQAKETA